LRKLSNRRKKCEARSGFCPSGLHKINTAPVLQWHFKEPEISFLLRQFGKLVLGNLPCYHKPLVKRDAGFEFCSDFRGSVLTALQGIDRDLLLGLSNVSAKPITCKRAVKACFSPATNRIVLFLSEREDFV
jgi:hypothetical protein